jgi:hypothetical protein
MAASWGEFLKLLIGRAGSDLQMPLYMVWLWVWEKVAGHSEWALRAANIPWFVAAQLILWWGLHHRRKWAWTALIFSALSPFLWQYLDEARPYIMQYSGACAMLASMVRLFDAAAPTPSRWSTRLVFILGTLVVCGSNMLGVLFAAPAALLVVLGFKWIRSRPEWRWSILDGVAFALGGLFLGGLGVFYAWTLSTGAGASRMGSAGLLSLAFSIYELMGWSGLGPGRLSIRENGITAFVPHLVPLVFLSLNYLLVLAAWMGSCRPSVLRSDHWPHVLGIAAITTLPVACLVLLSHITEFRVLGRHLMPLAPWVLVAWAGLAATLWERKRVSIKALVVSLIIFLLASCLQFRGAERHAKDDYRSAAAWARFAVEQQSQVWWIADRAAALYYQVPIDDAHFVVLQRPSAEQLSTLPTPVLICLSKPDVYDPDGVVAHWMSNHADFQMQVVLPGFQIWGHDAPASWSE